MSKAQIIERERRWAGPASAAAAAAVVLYLVSIFIEQGAGLQSDGPESEQLRSFHEHAGALLASTIVRGFGFALMSLPLLYLFRAAQARSDRVRPEMVGFCFLGPALLAVQGVVAWIASQNVADEFIGRAVAGGHAARIAKDLIDNDATRQVASALLIPAVLGMAVALVYIPLQAVRTGLLSRFWGTLGMALGASMFLIFPIALLAILLWLIYLALLFQGRAPGGVPPAWPAGEAIPLEVPGEKAPAASAAGGDGPPAGEDPEAPDAAGSNARRQPAKRKRKRRRQA